MGGGGGFSGEGGVDGVFEVVDGRFAAGLAEVDVAVVDAAVIDEAVGLAGGDEDGGFGGDFGAHAGDPLVFGVLEGGHGVAKILAVFFDGGGGFVAVWVDEEEADALSGVLVVDLFDFGGVAVGDGAVSAGKKKDDGAGDRGVERMGGGSG